MTEAVLCDRCGIRIDKGWSGRPLTVKNTTGTGGPREIHLCLGCHTEIRGELYDLLLGEDGAYEHPENMMDYDGDMEMVVTLKPGADVAYGDKTGLEACETALMAELGPGAEDVEVRIFR